MGRREFLKLTGGGIIVLFAVAGAPVDAQRRGYPTDFNAYLRIRENGRVDCFTGKIEMGQGVITSLAQMAAEELGVSFHAVDMVMGDTALCPYDRGTWSSMTTRFFGPALRLAAARARAVLVELAAERLDVSASELAVHNGEVYVESKPELRVSFAELTRGKRITRTLSNEAVEKAQKDFGVIGVDHLRADASEKVTGAARYAGDIRYPDMLYARVVRPPSHASAVKSIDVTAAQALEGVAVVRLDDLTAVLHADPEVAEKALDLVTVEYDTPAEVLDQNSIHEHLLAVAPDLEEGESTGDPARGEAAATDLFEHTYYDGYYAHAPMEPHTAVADYQDGKIELWVSTQSPFGDRQTVARALGMEEDDVRVRTPFVGGGFGGKSTNIQAVEAARLSRAVGRPVQVAWTRAEEFFMDTFRPAAVIKIRSGTDSRGLITLWDYSVYFAGSRGAGQFYSVPNSRVRVAGHWRGGEGTHPFSTGPWRAPGANTNVFAKEAQIDTMASRAGIDPLEFRLRNLKDERMIGVLKAVAERFGWTPAAGPSQRGVGIACGVDSGTYVATMAEVGVDRGSCRVEVKRVTCAQDMGLVINPEGARIQMEGCITMGLGYALTEELRFRGGKVLDSSFATYKLPQFSAVPHIDTVIIDAGDAPAQGGGEPAIITMGGAIANAVFDACGARVCRLPLTPARIRRALPG